MKRGSGILLPVSSLPSPYGIGTFGEQAYEFVDFLQAAGQKYWQVLPLGPISYGDSPYQSFSAFAGNPYYIDLQRLIEEGLLTMSQVNSIDWEGDQEVDYAILYQERFKLLRTAYQNSLHKEKTEYLQFCKDHEYWLGDYSTYMAFKNLFGDREWLQWPKNIRFRQPAAMGEWTEQLQEEINFWKFCQYKFFSQWLQLKAYANKKGIEIIGDIPIYVALDSADVWVHHRLFDLDDERKPKHVAGVPPDLFSSTGQLWGNPLYHWKQMEQEDFFWWKARINVNAILYDVIRIDHFIGIVHYYSIPASQDTAEEGVWLEGPGEKLLFAMNSVIGDKRIIAENLGIVTAKVKQLLKKSGYPGMKLLEMAFDSDSSNENLPIHYEKNCVVYGGTHDNETLAGYFSHQKRKVLKFAREYLNVRTHKEIPKGIIYAAYQSTANTVIFLMQDILGMDNRARINTPATLGGNWKWRMKKDQLSGRLARKLKKLTFLYGR